MNASRSDTPKSFSPKETPFSSGPGLDSLPFIEARNINKSFRGHRALIDVSLSIPRGSVFGLLGPNGAGKTTFLRILNQIFAPDSGEILLDGRLLKSTDVERIGYLPEERGLYKKMKAGEQVVYLARLRGLSQRDAVQRARHWFKEMDLTDWWDKKIEELSKGMGQKVQFISTVIHEPELLILDEPFSGFDPLNAEKITQEILKLQARGITIIFSTHRMETVEALCDRVVLINKSRNILEGPKEEIRQRFKKNIFTVQSPQAFPPESYSALEVLDQGRDAKGFWMHMRPKKDMNAALAQLMKKGEVRGVQEVVPSMHDIFIEVVRNYREQPSAGKEAV